jgi:Ca2+-binding EF-hand superfamily protein
MGGTKVLPDEPPAGQGILSLETLQPDLDRDGKVDSWEQEVYDKLIAADADGDGVLTREELFGVMKTLNGMAKRGGISITTLDPDTDGDGKVEKWEIEVFDRIKAADADQSGTISAKELFGVIRGAAESDRQKRLFRKLFAVAGVLVIIMVFANMALTAAVVFLAKDTITPPTGVSTTTGGARPPPPHTPDTRPRASHCRPPTMMTALIPSSHAGEPLRPGAYSVGATAQTARARRLREFNGRMLVSVGDLAESNCRNVLDAVQQSGESKGNARVNTQNGGTDFVAGKIANQKQEGDTNVVTVTSEAGTDPVEIHDCDQAYVVVERQRMRKLSVAEAFTSRRRLAVRLDDDRKPLEEGCLVYHCFEGDKGCATPSPRDACAAWEEGEGGACLEPLCAYVMGKGE